MDYIAQTHWQTLAATRCQLCARSGSLVIDPVGAAVCQPCLRLIDADQARKRRILFGSAAFA